MKYFSNTLALCLSAGALTLALPAHAQLSGTQMQSAKSDIASGKLPALDLNCPSVAIPANVIRNQADLDKMNVSLKAREACVQTIRDTTFEPNLRSLVQVTYPKATDAQVVELTATLVTAVKPIRERVLEELRSVQTNAINVGRPFVLRTRIQNLFLREADKCTAPAQEQSTSVSRAQAYLREFEPFDKCLDKVTTVLANLDEKKFVEKVLESESDLMKGQILLDFSKIQREIVNEIRELYRATLPARIRAQRYIATNGRTDQPYYPGGTVEDDEDK